MGSAGRRGGGAWGARGGRVGGGGRGVLGARGSTAPRADLMGPAPLSLCLARCVPASRACPLALLRGVVCCCVWYVVCLHCPVYARASCCRALPACAVAIIVRFPSDGRVDKDQQSRTLHERRRVHPIGGDTDRRDTAELVSQTATLRRPPALLCATIAIYSRGTCLRHADCDAGLLAACRCHLVPPPATSADAACVAKTKCRNCTLCFFASPQGPKGYRAHGQNEIMHAYGPESTPIGRMYMCGCVCGCMHTCRGV